MNYLKISDNIEPIEEQKTAILLWVGDRPLLDIDPKLRKKLVGNITNGNKSCIITLWIGDKDISFTHVRNFSTPLLRKLKKQIGERFEIIIESDQKKPNDNNGNFFDKLFDEKKQGD